MRLFIALVFVAGIVMGAPVPCSDFSGPMAITPAGGPVGNFDCGSPLTFRDFQNVASAGDPTPQIDLVSAWIDTASLPDPLIVLNFNPNMNAPAPFGSQDQWLFFAVDGPLTGVGLLIGGRNASVFEVACFSPIGPSMPMCNTGDVLATMQAFSPPADNGDLALITTVGNTTYFGKDISVSDDYPYPNGGSLSMLVEGFRYDEGTVGTPEPATLSMSMLGVGLVWFIRKVRKS